MGAVVVLLFNYDLHYRGTLSYIPALNYDFLFNYDFFCLTMIFLFNYDGGAGG